MVAGQTVLLKGVTIISSILLARILGPEQFGLWAIVTATSGIVWIVAELGLGASVIPLIAEARGNQGRIARVQATAFLLAMGLGGAIIAGYVASTPLLATSLYSVPGALPLFLLVAGSMVMNLAPGMFVAFLQAKRQIRILAIGGFVLGAANAVGLVAGAALAGLFGALLVSFFLNAAACVAFLLLLPRDRGTLRLANVDRAVARNLFGLGLPTVAWGLLAVLSGWVALTLMSLTGGNDPVGQYSVAWRAAAFIGVPSMAVFVVLFPAAGETFQSDPALFRRIFRQTMRYMILGIVPLSLGFALLSPEIVPLLYGPSYGDAPRLLAMLASGGFLAAMVNLGNMLFYVDRSMLRGTVLVATATAAQIIAAALLIPRYGVAGLAASTLVYQFVMVALLPRFLKDAGARSEVARAFAWSLAAAVLLFGAGTFAFPFSMAARAIAYGAFLAIYGWLALAFVIKEADREFLRGLLRGVRRRLRLG